MEFFLTRISIFIAETDWASAGAQFELGHHNARQLAFMLGVSPQTFGRQMKKRGLLKGARVAETQVEHIAELDRKAKLQLDQRIKNFKGHLERAQDLALVMGNLVDALLAADQDGDIKLSTAAMAAVAAARK